MLHDKLLQHHAARLAAGADIELVGWQARLDQWITTSPSKNAERMRGILRDCEVGGPYTEAMQAAIDAYDAAHCETDALYMGVEE